MGQIHPRTNRELQEALHHLRRVAALLAPGMAPALRPKRLPIANRQARQGPIRLRISDCSSQDCDTVVLVVHA